MVPAILDEPASDLNSAASQRAMTALLEMKKLDIAALKQAYAGRPSRSPSVPMPSHRRTPVPRER